VLFALAESPLEEGIIWAGTNDGLLHITRDSGSNWTNVTKNIPDLPPWGTISNIEPSRYEAGTCYITIDFHQVNNRDPFVYKTSDYGRKWKSISSNIPKTVLSYAHCVREDPVRPGLLYLGTENAIYVSFDDGKNWQPLQNNLPTPEILKSDVHLFPPRPAYRFRNVAGPSKQTNEQCAGKNPPYGAAINYYLKSKPKDNIKLSIYDENGKTVRTLKPGSTASSGT